MQAIRENLWLRVLIVVALLVVLLPLGLWTFGNAADKAEVSRFLVFLSLSAASVLGYCLPALVLGAAWGWIKYSKSVWLWTTGCLLAVTLTLYLFTITHPV
jgi:hypothetical protein